MTIPDTHMPHHLCVPHPMHGMHLRYAGCSLLVDLLSQFTSHGSAKDSPAPGLEGPGRDEVLLVSKLEDFKCGRHEDKQGLENSSMARGIQMGMRLKWEGREMVKGVRCDCTKIRFDAGWGEEGCSRAACGALQKSGS